MVNDTFHHHNNKQQSPFCFLPVSWPLQTVQCPFYCYLNVLVGTVNYCQVCPVSCAADTVAYFSGIAKWLWSRCRQWRRPSRPWLTFTTTTWGATSTWESPSPSRPFEGRTHSPRVQCLRHPPHGVWTHRVNQFCWSCHSLRERLTFWHASSFFKREQLSMLRILDPPSY